MKTHITESASTFCSCMTVIFLHSAYEKRYFIAEENLRDICFLHEFAEQSKTYISLRIEDIKDTNLKLEKKFEDKI